MRVAWTMMIVVASCMLMAAGAVSAAQGDPAPKSIAGKSAKEVGGYYDTERKLWMVPSRLVAAKNECISRMQKGGR